MMLLSDLENQETAMSLALKPLLAPLLIAAATLAGRRWGPTFIGWRASR
jgi:hypothetical protein